MEVSEPDGALVVEVGERALLEHALSVLGDGEQTRGQRGHHVGLLAHQLGRVEPAPAPLVERPRRLGDGVAVRALLAAQRLVGGVEGPREGERLERRGGRVARAVLEARPHAQRPQLVRPRVQHPECVVVFPRDCDELVVGKRWG